jgi:hypothetical protein
MKELPARLQFNRIVRFVRFQLSFPFKLIMGISVQLIVSPKNNTNQYKNDLTCIGACLWIALPCGNIGLLWTYSVGELARLTKREPKGRAHALSAARTGGFKCCTRDPAINILHPFSSILC